MRQTSTFQIIPEPRLTHERAAGPDVGDEVFAGRREAKGRGQPKTSHRGLPIALMAVRGLPPCALLSACTAPSRSWAP